MTDLASAKAKLVMANVHIDAAKKLLETFFGSGFYKLASRRQQNIKNRYFVIVKTIDPLPPELGLFVGDAAHNLRSSLDHIAYAFAKPAQGQEKHVSFPLLSKRGTFKERAASCLPGVSKKVLASIEKLQPYHGRKGSNTKVLGQIQAIDNWDKHRSVLMSAVGSDLQRLEVKLQRDAPITNPVLRRNPILERDAIIARFNISPNVPSNEHMQVKAVLGLHPVFDERMPPEIRKAAVMDLLLLASKFVGEVVIPKFERL